MLKPSNTIFTIVSFAMLLSFTGYLKGNRQPYIMYIIIFLITITAIYSAIFIIKSFENQIELKSISLAFFGLIYSFAMNPYISILTIPLFLHLFLFTPISNELPDLSKSMGEFLIKNIQITNKIILIFFIIITFLLLLVL